MKKTLKRIIGMTLTLVMTLNIACPALNEGIGLFAGLLRAARAESRQTAIPEPFLLSDSDLTGETSDGEWIYALRSDGYAQITGYTGPGGSVTVPKRLSGAAVAGVGSRALADVPLTDVSLHGNILYIADDAFGSSAPRIRAHSGTAGVYYADRHGLEYEVTSEHTFVPGVIDYTDSAAGSVERRGDEYVVLNALEAMRLSVGSIFYFEDVRGTAFFYRVTSLAESGGRVRAGVEVPEIAETFIEAHVRERHVFTADEFTPAEGVTVVDEVSAAAIVTDSDKDEINVDLSFGVSNKSGASVTVSCSASMVTVMDYVIDIHNGVMTAMSMEKNVSIDMKTSLMGTMDLTNAVAKPRETLAPGATATPAPDDMPVLEQLLGGMKFTCGWFNATLKLSYGASVSGSVTAGVSSVSTTREHYDFDKEEWVVDYENGNASRNKDDYSVSTSISGKISISLSGTIAVFELVKVLEMKVEVGVKISAGRTVATSDENAELCLEIIFAAYIKLTLTAGAWASAKLPWQQAEGTMTIGLKKTVLSKEYSHHELFGEEGVILHISNLEPPVHLKENCPYKDRYEVKFDTRTSQLINPVLVIKEQPVPDLPEYHLAASEQYGDFLGWSEDPESSVPTWELGDYNYPVKENMTLYAVWAITAPVTFNSAGGTPDKIVQNVPVGGYASAPEDPVMDGNTFLYWYVIEEDGSTRPWKFGVDTVPAEGVTLVAKWAQGYEFKTGTTEIMYIGDRGAAAQKPYIAPTEYESFLRWEYMKSVDGSILGINIVGLKGNPSSVVIPEGMYITVGYDTNGLPIYSYQRIVNVYTTAFGGSDDLKYVWFDTSIGVDTDHMFAYCEGLIYVDLSQTYMTTVQQNAFTGCTSLQCVKLPAGISQFEDLAFKECRALPEANMLKGISSLGLSCFEYCESLAEVTIPDTVTRIGMAAFNYCTSLKKLEIPASAQEVASASHSCIMGSTGLEELIIGGPKTIETGVYEIGAVSEDNIKKITVKGTVENIGKYAFSNSSYSPRAYNSDTAELQVVVEKGVQTIGEGAFRHCSAITDVQLPETMTILHESAFENCIRLKSVDLGGTIYIGDKCFENCANLTNPGFRDDLYMIGNSAYLDCASLPYMFIPEGVKAIGTHAFDGCTSMETLYIPDTAKTVSVKGQPVIGGCRALKTISIGGLDEIPQGVFSIGTYDDDNLELLHIRGTVGSIGDYAFSSSIYSTFAMNSTKADAKLIIEDGVGDIGVGAFRNCTAFTSAEIGRSSILFDSYSFAGCSRLETLDCIGVQTVGDHAFKDCTALVDPELPPSLRLISTSAFENCDSIVNMILPHGLEAIGASAFDGCGALDTLFIPDSVITISNEGTSIISGCSKLRVLSVGGVDEIRKSMFSTGSIGDHCLEQVVIRGSVRKIGDYAFSSSSYSSLAYDSTTAQAELIVEDGVESIGTGAFYRCTAFTEISLPDSLTEIGEKAFQGCSRVTEANSGGAVVIGPSAFRGMSALKDFTFGDGLRSIGQYAFYECKLLEDASLPEGVVIIEANAFGSCTALRRLVIPSTVTTLSSGTASIMSGCKNIRSLVVLGPETVPGKALSTGSNDEDSLQELIIGGSVKTLAANAFSSNPYNSTKANARLWIQEGVETLGSKAFYNCTAFTEVILHESVKIIGDQAFSGMSRMTFMQIGSDVELIGTNALQNCKTVNVCLTDENQIVQDYLANLSIPFQVGSKPAFRLTLDANGGKFSDRSETKLHGVAWQSEIPAMETPQNSYHVFCGWYLDEACTQPWMPSAMPARDLTLYAGWDIEVYTLTLNPMGGALTGASVLRVPAGTRPVDNIAPALEGFSFTGWFLDALCTDEFSGRMPENDLTLYAGWAPVSENAEYEMTAEGAKLTRYTMVAGESRSIRLPETVDGVPLTEIASGAFDGQDAESLHLPANLLSLEDGALDGMDSLKSITVGTGSESFTAKNGVLFSGDGTTLVRFPAQKSNWYTVPNGVTEIAGSAFENAALQSVAFSSGLVSIGESAFAGTRISLVTLPDSVRSIESRAFYGCDGLTTVVSGDGLTSVAADAFDGGSPLMLMYGPEGGALCDYAEAHGHFFNYYQLTLDYGVRTGMRLQRAGEVIQLPERADVGENLSFTGWFADADCTEPAASPVMPHGDLTLYAGGTPVFEYEAGAESVTLTKYLLSGTDVTVPETLGGLPVTAIASGCFGSGVKSLTVPACVTAIESGAIASGTALTCPVGSAAETYASANGNAVLRNTYTLRFDGCGGLSPAGIEAAEGASVTLPETVRDGYVFAGWYADAELTEAAASPYVMGSADLTLYAAWTFEGDEPAPLTFTWAQDGDHITVTGMAEGAENVIIPGTLHGLPVTEMAESAFAGCAGLLTVTLPGSIETIPESAFRSCRHLRQVALGEGVTVIGENAFSGCLRLTEINLPASLERIASGALDSTAVEEMTLGAGFVFIAADALNGCRCLRAIHVDPANPYYRSENGVLYDLVENSLARYPAGKTDGSFTVPEGINVIGANAFRGAASLKSVVLPDSLWTLGESAFAGCAGLTALPGLTAAALTNISDGCFSGCSSLKEIVIPGNILTIGSRAFAACTALKTAVVPATVGSIGSMAFPAGTVIRGTRGSCAQQYAEKTGLLFVGEGDVLPESIRLSASEITLTVGETALLTASILPANAAGTDPVWAVSDRSVLSVSETGLVRALAAGSAKVYAFTENGLSAECTVTVSGEIAVEKLVLSQTKLTLTAGDAANLTCRVLPDTAAATVEWMSSDAAVATVDAAGLVTAVADGTCTITASAGGMSAQCAVTVGAAEAALQIFAPAEIVKNRELALKAMLLPDMTEAENVAWSLSDSDIAQITADGVLTFRRPGYVTVTAATASAECSLTLECAAASRLTLPKAVREIAAESFLGCAAEEIVLPAGTKTIGSRAFADSAALSVIRIPASVTSIAADAFNGSENVCICAPTGSVAARYAETHGLKFVSSN
ncbi:MAG: leucine-rich repeat protein [Clostridia bacterium]|nr:leucine-rich repeat protein [Clostridia bacterium]